MAKRKEPLKKNPQNTESSGKAGEFAPDNSQNSPPILKSSTESEQMEVHHHAHHDHGPGSWKANIREFLMLFLAVFCGFLAEYTLEHKIEGDREKQFMESMIEDLMTDTSMINSNIKSAKIQLGRIDSIVILVNNDAIISRDNLARLYILNFSVRLHTVNFEDRTSLQLKNSGGMRLIRNKAVNDRLMSYWKNTESIGLINQRIMNTSEEVAAVGRKIFHNKYIIREGAALDIPKGLLEGVRLINDDPRLLAEYSNLQSTKALRTGVILERLPVAKEKAAALIDLIRKEYKLE